MLLSALAYFFAFGLTVILGGLITFFVKAILALTLFAILALVSSGSKRKVYGNESPQVLTIEFLSNIFYGYFANNIGIWVFNYLEVPIDWFYPIFMLFAFIWFDMTRMRNERLRIEKFDSQGLRNRIPNELFPNGAADPETVEHAEINKENMISILKNLRMTGLFGKITGVIIGGLQLIIRAN